MIHMAPQRASADHYGLLLEVHMNMVQRRKIDHQSVVAHSQTAGVVPAATNRHEQALLPGELYRRHDIGYVGAARDQSWAPLDHRVVHFASSFVACVRSEERRVGK